MANMAKIAKTLRIREGEQVVIDGQPFQYQVLKDDVQITALDAGRLSVVWLPIIVENVEVQSRGES
jgi:hypothetical protein